ncbi:DUF2867 domain-containing protein [Nocardia fusca]|uniref:DUF2867 domain-containing protein n=1 Tax=Nocardia fusca TaxID=941183 RepID=UPI0037C61311
MTPRYRQQASCPHCLYFKASRWRASGRAFVVRGGSICSAAKEHEKREMMTRRALARAYPAPAAPTALLLASGIRDDWSDCQRQPVTPNASTDPAEWARRIFHDPPRWVAAALSVRDRVVAILRLRSASPETFRVLARNGDEVLVGSDDRHLDFRASVRRTDDTVDVITFVEIHNLLGRLYLGPVRLVHASMVRQMLRRAARHLDSPVHRR